MSNRGIISGSRRAAGGTAGDSATRSPHRRQRQAQKGCQSAHSGGSSGGDGGTRVRTEMYDQIARLMPAAAGEQSRHPARLVGDAIGILGVAQEGIRGEACRRVIKKARSALIAMLDGRDTPSYKAASCGAQSGGGGRKGRRRGSGSGSGSRRRKR